MLYNTTCIYMNIVLGNADALSVYYNIIIAAWGNSAYLIEMASHEIMSLEALAALYRFVSIKFYARAHAIIMSLQGPMH